MPDIAYAIREARWSDCGAMARKLCDGRWLAYTLAGFSPRRKLIELVGHSSISRSCLIEGRLVAMWGVTGTILNPNGTVWLALSPEAANHRFALLREVRRQLAEISRTKRLHARIQEQDGTARLFAEFVGFRAEDVPYYDDKLGVSVIPMVYGG